GIFGDSQLYAALGFNLATGRAFVMAQPRATTDASTPAVYEPVITRGPVYPYFISLVYRVETSDVQNADAVSAFNRVRYVQAVLDALTCVAVFALARALFPGSYGPALLAALLAALC